MRDRKGVTAALARCRDLTTDLLTIKVIDEDRIGSDDLIGICRASLVALADGQLQDLRLPVVGSDA